MLQIPVAKVAVLAATFAFDRPYTYKIPQPLTDTLRPGCRVMVPFSRGNRPCEGMVLALDQAQDDPKLKPITRQLDPEPILSPELIRLAIWMHDRFFCTIYDALHAILPAGVWYRVSTVYCAAPELDADAALTLCGRSKQRRLALETVLAHGGRCPLETLQTAFGDKDPASTLHWLVEQKLLTVEGAEKRVVRDKQLEYASLAVSLEEAQEEIRRRRRAPHQVAILELLCTIGRASADEVCQFTGAPKSSMKTLVRQELVHIDTEPYFRRPTHYTGQPKPIPVLTAAQAEVFSGLQALLRSPDAQAALLFNEAIEALEEGYAGTAFKENELAQYYREAEDYLSRCSEGKPLKARQSSPQNTQQGKAAARSKPRSAQQTRSTKNTAARSRSTGTKQSRSTASRSKKQQTGGESRAALGIILAVLVLGLIARAISMGLV